VSPGSLHAEKKPFLEPEEEEVYMEEAWPHLQVVYELLLRFIIAKEIDSKLLRSHLSPPFL